MKIFVSCAFYFGSRLKAIELLAHCYLKKVVARRPPVVISSVFMKEMRPMMMVETPQFGLHSSGWKSLKLIQIGVLVAKRPLGVIIFIRGGLKGYSFGKESVPW